MKLGVSDSIFQDIPKTWTCVMSLNIIIAGFRHCILLVFALKLRMRASSNNFLFFFWFWDRN